MALIDCPECGKKISDKALICPQCGFSRRGGFYCFEYRSQRKLFGLPLLHIVLGPAIDPSTGRLRVAKGVIAIGGVSVGLISLGGLSVGLISIGGLAVGLAAIGGCALGLCLAVGGMAIGFVAIGGGALGYYVLGGGAWGVHALRANEQHPEAVGFFKQYLGSWVERLGKGGGR